MRRANKQRKGNGDTAAGSGGIGSIRAWPGLTLVLLLGVAPLVFRSGTSDITNLPQSVFILAGTLGCFLLWIGIGFFDRDFVLTPDPLALPLLLFLSWTVLSVLLARNTFEALAILSYWFPAGVVYAVVRHAAFAPPMRRRLLGAMFVVGSAASLLGIAQYLLGFDGVPQVVSPAATFANKNMASHVLVLTWPLGVFFILRARTRLAALGAVCGTATILLYLVYTGTRAGWVAFLAQVPFLFVLLWRERRGGTALPPWGGGTKIAAVSIVALFLVALNFGPQGLTGGFFRAVERAGTVVRAVSDGPEKGKDATATWRLAVWRNACVMVRDRPLLGFGLGNARVFYPAYRERVVKDLEFSEKVQLDHIHNESLQVAVEMGLPGLALLLWLVAAFGRKALDGFRSADSEVRLVAAVVSSATVGLMVIAQFDYPLHRAVPPLLLLAQWGVLTSTCSPPAEGANGFRNRLLPGALAGSAVLALGFLLWFQGCAFAADRHILAVWSYERAGAWEGLLREGRIALRLDPWQTRSYGYSGHALLELGRNREAIADLEKEIADYPYQMNSLLNLCTAYFRIGDSAQALKTCGRVLAIKKDFPKVHRNFGVIYMSRGEWDLALASYRTAATLAPKDAKIQLDLGTVAAQKGLFEEAATAFARAVQSNPAWDRAQMSLGVVLVQELGRPDEGVPHLREALSLNPNIDGADDIRALIENYDNGEKPARLLSREGI